MRAVAITPLPSLDARAWPGLAEGLRREGRPRLVVAPLTGGALALGRWQLDGATLGPGGRGKPAVRRPTGGRAIGTGAGLVAVGLALPHRAWLVAEREDDLPSASFLNRGVRLLLAGLARLGIAASYGGRDFVTVAGGQGAYLSFDVGTDGHALLEAYLPAGAHWWPSDDWLAAPVPPPSRGFPGPAMVDALAGRPVETLADALSHGLEDAYGLATFADDAPLPPRADVEAPFAGDVRSAAVDGASVRAWASVGLIGGASVTGEVLADSAGMQALSERATRLGPSAGENLRVLEQVYGNPRHALLGVRDLPSVAEAFARAIRERRDEA